MGDNGSIQRKPFIEYLDTYIYVKNGHSFLIHLVPFSIAALLLLTLSVPSPNMLLELAKSLNKPSLTYFPAGILTMVTAVLYLISLSFQIRQGYLWSDHDLRRTICTTLVYIILCSLMAYAVLSSSPSAELSPGTVWACILVSLLSLNGIGWKGPTSWVKLIDARSPNYTEGRLYSRKLSEVIQNVQSKPQADNADVADFYEAAKNLRASIEKNLKLEPKWARGNLPEASKALRTLLEEVDTHFRTSEPFALMDFAAVCDYKKSEQYKQFVTALQTLAKYCGDLKYEEAK